MALFYKRAHPGLETSLYTIGAHDSVVVVGLGNPGKKYDGTRHNLGFACLDDFALRQEFPAWIDKKDLRCQLTSSNLGGTRVILVKPTTFMNLSGQAVQAVLQFYKLPLETVLVVHDELDIAFGKLRLGSGGGTAGHNGLKSLVERIGPDFARVRIGIGPKSPPEIDSADYVLGKFNKEERAALPAIIREVNSIIGEFTATHNLPAETRNIVERNPDK